MVGLVTGHALNVGGAVRHPGMTGRAGKTGGNVRRVEVQAFRPIDRPRGDSRSRLVTFRARHGIAEPMMAGRTSGPTFETDTPMIVERRMAGRARQIRRLDVRAVRERTSQPLRSLRFDSEVAPQADVLSHCRSDVHRRHVEFDTADGTGLVYKLERRPEQLIGKYDVVGAPADSYQLQVFSRQSQQAVRCRSNPGGSAAGCTLRLSDDALDASEPLLHLVLPRGQDIGVLNPVTRHASRFASHLDLLVSFHFPRQAMAASA
jgi:hypothetical protein